MVSSPYHDLLLSFQVTSDQRRCMMWYVVGTHECYPRSTSLINLEKLTRWDARWSILQSARHRLLCFKLTSLRLDGGFYGS